MNTSKGCTCIQLYKEWTSRIQHILPFVWVITSFAYWYDSWNFDRVSKGQSQHLCHEMEVCYVRSIHTCCQKGTLISSQKSHYKITKRTLEPCNQGTEFLWGIFQSMGDRVNLGVLGGPDSLSGGKKRREPCLCVKAGGRQWQEACPSPKPATNMWLSRCK